MGLFDLSHHLLNFAAPALALALFFAVFDRVFRRKQAGIPVKWTYIAINFIVGLVVLGAGLWFFGRDGMMATYAALVLAVGTCRWWMTG